ncbi:circumsporozoite protein-like [Ischnura elegans]|uniref:circumsporozoite protein-like n=1 Tax=Ischnura elegans TaxID=197161 RepID=UPI001ED885D9|nr:circumsporozoite protein-like [Ischnura elegans]
MDRPGGKKTSKSSNGGGGAAAAGGGGGAGGTAPAGGAGGGGAGGGGGPGGGGSGDDPKAPGAPAGKDEGKEGKDGAGEDQPAGAKPSSAGANLLANLREMANRVLNFSLKSDWPPVEGALKNMDRLVAQGATAEDGGPALPLAGLMDPVRHNLTHIHRASLTALCRDKGPTAPCPIMF